MKKVEDEPEHPKGEKGEGREGKGLRIKIVGKDKSS